MRNVKKRSQVWLLMGLLMGLASCRTAKVVEKHETVRVDSVVVSDTIVREVRTVVYDTAYVYDSYKETYAIGKIDTIYKIRVDTVRVSAVQYIYKGNQKEVTDSTVSAMVNSQKAATTDVRTVEKVTEKPVPTWQKACVVLALVVVAAIFYVAGNLSTRGKG